MYMCKYAIENRDKENIYIYIYIYINLYMHYIILGMADFKADWLSSLINFSDFLFCAVDVLTLYWAVSPHDHKLEVSHLKKEIIRGRKGYLFHYCLLKWEKPLPNSHKLNLIN